MYYTDYHTHTALSPDGHVPLREMARAAVEAGISELCVTDHYDLLEERGNLPKPPHDWGPSLRQFSETLPEFEGKLTLRLGLELGSAQMNPQYAASLLEMPELDFVIGSLHNWSREKGGEDFYYGDYADEGACHAALDDYFNSMAALAPQGGLYDVLGHIISPLRYMPAPVPLDRYMERLEAIFKDAVAAGRGIEVNTYRGRTLEAWRPILALYRDCGGEILTVGSDAHVPEGVGRGVPEAYELIRDMGFGYVAAYRRHNPQFIKL